jgi:hypothetical protein
LSNVVRAVAFMPATQAAVAVHDMRTGRIAQIDFDVDDQTGEDLAQGITRLRECAGVVDVLQTPAFGKKGRMVARVQVLARPDAVDDVVRACFFETSTLGLRIAHLERRELDRTLLDGPARVKVATRPDGSHTAKAESDDVDVPGAAARAHKRIEAEATALASIATDGARHG